MSDKSEIPFTLPACYLSADEAIEFLAKQFSDHLEFTRDRRLTRVRMIRPDAEMIISSVEPPRRQLLKELRRVAKVYSYVAQCLADYDWCEEEMESADEEVEWLKMHEGCAVTMSVYMRENQSESLRVGDAS